MLKEFSALLKPLGQRAKALEEIASGPWPDPLLENQALLDLMLELKPLAGLSSSLLEQAEARMAHLAPLAQDIQATFGAELEDLAAAKGLHIHGRWPKWTCGPLQIQVDLLRGAHRLYWGPEIEKLGEGRLQAAAIVDAIVLQKAAIEQDCGAEGLAELFFRAYELAVTNLGLPHGEVVPIREVFPFVALLVQGPGFLEKPGKAGWRREYTRAMLSWELAGLRGVKVRGRELRLRVATRDQTRSAGMAFWLPEGEAGAGTLFFGIQFAAIGS